ncbi:hypothetical protein RUMHYD_03430 [Blautia hydrogenotrophica DSM 10507]|uniref:Uncharacterized protein n=1 Tax=Blautia hydrogenotrophica (strain DSM 10507 / JCM 14656 / S5a33) TaxID=476272 RepID=C0CRB6_BLAHS|nr:hypothetical protein RUMHYD_03430 [Blautia hydrogenotrophica DSM 10507]
MVGLEQKTETLSFLSGSGRQELLFKPSISREVFWHILCKNSETCPCQTAVYSSLCALRSVVLFTNCKGVNGNG